ncbi:Asp23/Gls24 family envelope stress response protein [Streptomyces sp. NPDC006285]|uniref:Asp23/Gls24 family envelope stress response protein n=1 Tax=Streptomyces sp. NPDC006285 TaxID=3364742 RepID=UPI0036B28B85
MTAHTDPPAAGARGVADDLDEQLPCGRLLSRVWDDWEQQTSAGAGSAAGADPHLRTCPYCRESVRGLDGLESAVRDLRDETTDTSAYDATSVTERVMDVVRLELRPGRPLPLGEPAEDLWIMEAVAARALRAAAETVSGIRAGSCRVLPLRTSDAADGSGGQVEVRLALHAPAGVPLPDLADQVRSRVREAADRLLGMELAAVDIRITDLTDGGIDSASDSTTDSQEGPSR